MNKPVENNILEVRDLEVKFFSDEGTVNAANGVNFKVPAGKSIGIVGESGCGKTVTAYSVLQLLPSTGKITNGTIKYQANDGNVIDLTNLKSESRAMRRIRGGEISMIFQEPMTSFSPVHTICNQISEAIMLHQHLSKQKARLRAIEMLELVGIPNAKRRVDEYPFQFSGGMRQRAMIAMALACNPKILIADEPTTALDVTTQAQVLKLIQGIQDELNLSMILITHDLGVIAQMVDHVYIMYLGKVVESGSVYDIFDRAKHPYTRDLIQSIPKLHGARGERVTSIAGTVPSTYKLPKGCAFHARCSDMFGNICRTETPLPIEVGSDHYVSCFLHSREEGKNNARDAR